MISVAMIGFGGWARRMHVPALNKVQQEGVIQVCATCDMDAERASEAAAALGDCPHYTSLDDMLDKESPQALSLLASGSGTEFLIERAAQAGLPFLTEKPPATSADAQRRLIDIVGDLPHMVAYNRRFAPYTAIARAWMAQTDLHSVSVAFSRHKRMDKQFSSTYVHGLDAMLSFCGRARALQACISHRDGVQNLSLQVHCDHDCIAHLLVTPNAGAALEHYQLRSAQRYVDIAFPQFGMYDLPGSIACFENNELQSQQTASDLGIAEDDMCELGGIANEYRHLAALVAGKSTSHATLSDTLQTQIIREFLDQQDSGSCSLSLD